MSDLVMLCLFHYVGVAVADTHLVRHTVKHWYFFVPQFHCINNTAAGVAAAAGFTEVCLQSSEAHTSNQPGGGPKIRIYFRF